MTSRQALEMKQQPKSIVIVGAGAIGAEFAYFLNAFGTKVTLVEMDQVLPVEDHETAAVVERSFKKDGIDCRTSTAVENIQVGSDSVTMDLVKGDKKESITADSILLAIGVVANTEGFSPRVKLGLDRGYVKVDDNHESTVMGIFAAGGHHRPTMARARCHL